MSHVHSELVRFVKSGDADAFLKLKSDFDSVLRSITAQCDVDSNEKEDLYQEGLIGLYKAALAYDENNGAPFSVFARVCIKHSIDSALRIYYGKKNYPIRSYLPIDYDGDEAKEVQGLGPVTEPERLLIEKESYLTLLNIIDDSLSAFERDVLKLYVQGRSYGEISKRLKVSAKSVDNAIQRIRGKLKLFIRT